MASLPHLLPSFTCHPVRFLKQRGKLCCLLPPRLLFHTMPGPANFLPLSLPTTCPLATLPLSSYVCKPLLSYFPKSGGPSWRSKVLLMGEGPATVHLLCEPLRQTWGTFPKPKAQSSAGIKYSAYDRPICMVLTCQLHELLQGQGQVCSSLVSCQAEPSTESQPTLVSNEAW